MILEKLTLHKSIGIQRGLGLETITIPFDKFEKGLILLKGSIGTGKSTILKNLTPYRSVASDKFNDFNTHFDSKGYKHLSFVFNKHHYLCQVHGHTAKLFEDGTLLNKDEKVSSYDEAVEGVFGKRDYFFKMLFSGREMSAISDLTKGQRKDIIIDYLADYLQVYGQLNKLFLSKKEDSREELIKIRAYIENYGDVETTIVEVTQSLQEIEDSIKDLQELLAKFQKRLESTQTFIQKAEVQRVKYEKSFETLQEFKKEQNLKLRELHKQFDDLVASAEEDEIKYEVCLEEVEELSKTHKELLSEKSKIGKLNVSKLNKDLQKSRKDLQEAETLESNLAQYHKDLEVLGKQIKEFEKQKHPCTEVLKQREAAILIKVKSFKQSLAKFDIKSLESTVETLETQIKEAQRIEVIEKELLYTQRNLSKETELINKMAKVIKYNKEKRRQIQDELNKAHSKLDTKLERLTKEVESLKVDEDGILEAIQKVEELKRKIEKVREAQEIALADKGRETERLTQLQTAKENIETYKAKEHQLVKMIKSYEGLIRFSSKEGYIVYDLEKIGERISQIANQDLLSFYEKKHFVIKFETLRKGKEVFDILVSINGNPPQELSLASSGERVCCNTAIKEAMSYIRENKNFRTGFIDEIDGAMDIDSRGDFLAMVRKAHKLNYRYHTLLISHSSEVINEITQRIELFPNEQIKLIY